MFRSLVSPRRNNSLADGRQELSRMVQAKRAVSPARFVTPQRAVSTTSPSRKQMITFSYSNKQTSLRKLHVRPQQYQTVVHPIRHNSSSILQQEHQVVRIEPQPMIMNQPAPTVIRLVQESHCCCQCKHCNFGQHLPVAFERTEKQPKSEAREKAQSNSYATQTISVIDEESTPIKTHHDHFKRETGTSIPETFQDDPPQQLRNDSLYTNTVINKQEHSLVNMDDFLVEDRAKHTVEGKSFANNETQAHNDPLQECISSLEQRVQHLLSSGTVKRKNRMLMQIVHQGGKYSQRRRDF